MEISFIGLGAMGYPMALNLSKKSNHKIFVFNRTKSKTESLYKENTNINPVYNIVDALKNKKVIIFCVSNEDVVEKIIKENIEKISPKTIIIDHTTTSSTFPVEINNFLSNKQIDFLDCPVTGGEIGAIKGTLATMVGGKKKIFDEVENIIACYSTKSVFIGKSGHGQSAKMINQICVIGAILGLSEGIKLGKSLNVNLEKVFSIINEGAASSWQMKNRALTMVDRKYDFGFAIDLIIKDLNICISQANKNKISLEYTNKILDLYKKLSEKGFNKSDSSALIEGIL